MRGAAGRCAALRGGPRRVRVKVDDVVTEETAYVAEYYLGKPLDVSTELLRAERVGLGALGLMVSAVWDRGATDWHRDYCSNTLAPLGGVQRDLAVNGSPYVQWNIALYNDDVFWVVPGSHRNPDSEEMRRQLLMDNKLELPGSFQVSLKAGDAIVYAAYILHLAEHVTARRARQLRFELLELFFQAAVALHQRFDTRFHLLWLGF